MMKAKQKRTIYPIPALGLFFVFALSFVPSTQDPGSSDNLANTEFQYQLEKWKKAVENLLVDRDFQLAAIQEGFQHRIHLLEELTKIIPQDLYIEILEERDGRVLVSGRSKSNGMVAILMRNIEASSWLHQVNLISRGEHFAPKNTAKQERPISKKFRLSMTLNFPQKKSKEKLLQALYGVLGRDAQISLLTNQQKQAAYLMGLWQSLWDFQASYTEAIRPLPWEDIFKASQRSGVVFVSLLPFGVSTHSLEVSTRNFMPTTPIHLKIVGNYHAFGLFLSELAALTPARKIEHFEITKEDENMVCTLHLGRQILWNKRKIAMPRSNLFQMPTDPLAISLHTKRWSFYLQMLGVKKQQPFRYMANGRRDPFKIPAVLKDTSTVEPPIEKEYFLADFPLEELEVVGEINLDKKIYLVRTPLGTMHSVQLGSVIGNARITAIRDGRLETIPIRPKSIETMKEAWDDDCIGENKSIYCKPWPLGDYPHF